MDIPTLENIFRLGIRISKKTSKGLDGFWDSEQNILQKISFWRQKVICYLQNYPTPSHFYFISLFSFQKYPEIRRSKLWICTVNDLKIQKKKSQFFSKNDPNKSFLRISHKQFRIKRSTSNPFGVFWSAEHEYAIKVGRGLDSFWDIGRTIFFDTFSPYEIF